MKKYISCLLVIVMMTSMACPAFACEVEAVGTDIMPYSAMSLVFSNLAPGARVYSAATYYISNEDAQINIYSCTWAPATQNIIIGYYNVDTGAIYGCSFADGEIDPIYITSNNVPDGEYQIYIQNTGTKNVTGVLKYSVT